MCVCLVMFDSLRPTSLLCWRRQWHPTLILLPGKLHWWRSLVGCSPWDCWGLGMTERLHFDFSLSCIGEGNGNPLVLAWRIPGTGEPGGLPCMGSHRVRHDWSDLAVAAVASSVYRIFQARILEWVAISYSRGSSQPRG